MAHRKKFAYTHLTLLALGIMAGVFFARWEAFHQLLLHLGNWGYIGAFVAGILFSSAFTVVTSIVILVTLGSYLHPLEIALIGAMGAVISDYLLFQFIRTDITAEMGTLYTRGLHQKKLPRWTRSKALRWVLPLLGALIIASPLPDEFGISLLGMSKLSRRQFVALTYIFNSLGIWTMIAISHAI